MGTRQGWLQARGGQVDESSVAYQCNGALYFVKVQSTLYTDDDGMTRVRCTSGSKCEDESRWTAEGVSRVGAQPGTGILCLSK